MAINTTIQDNMVLLPASARATHTYVIGQPGTGKSRALESWIMQDILHGRGVGVIDPHGELFDHLLSRIALLAEEHPDLAARTVIINPVDSCWTVGFNPLEAIDGVSIERLAAFLTDVVIKIWKIDVADAPRMVRLLAYTFLALAEAGLTLIDLPRFLLDEQWRDILISRTNHPDLLNYFHLEFPKNAGAIHQWVTPVLNKIGPLLFDSDLRLILASKSTITFKNVLNHRLVLLVNLSKGILGEGNSALLGAFIVAHLQKAAFARDDFERRRPFYLYLDEFQSYTTDNIRDILSESRKYGLSLILAHQYLDQLAPDLLGAVLNTTGTLACFRVGYQDASILSRELFPPRYLQESQWHLQFVQIGKLPLPIPHEERRLLVHEEVAAVLTQLDHREFVARRRGPFPPIKQRTLDMHAPSMSEKLLRAREHLVMTAGQRYGRLKREVRFESKYAAPEFRFPALNPGTIVIDYEQVS